MTLAPDVVAADLHDRISPKRFHAWRVYLSGLIIVTLATLGAAFLSDHYGPPLTLMALLLGLSLNKLTLCSCPQTDGTPPDIFIHTHDSEC